MRVVWWGLVGLVMGAIVPLFDVDRRYTRRMFGKAFEKELRVRSAMAAWALTGLLLGLIVGTVVDWARQATMPRAVWLGLIGLTAGAIFPRFDVDGHY